MTAWTFAGSNPALSLHNTGSAALTTHGVGNLIVLINTDHSTTDYPSGVSSSRVTWTKAVPDQGPNTNGNISQSPTQWNGNVWFGTVNSVGSDTVTFSYTSGTTPSFTNATAIEVTSPTGNWSLDSFAVLNSSSGTSTWPSVTPANSGTLVFGFAWNFGSAVSGSTSGYTYNSNADTAGNGYAYNLNAAGGTSTAAVWGDSTETYGIVVAVSQSPSGPSLIPGNELNLNTQSIETDASDWSALTNCSVAQSSAHAFDGTKSLAITATSSGTVDAIVNSGTVAFPAVTAGNPYQFFFAAYTTSSGINASANGDFYNVSTFVSSYSSPTIALIPNTWTWVSVTGIAPATSTLLRPIPQFTATAGGQVVYIDSVYFGAPTSIPAYSGTNGKLSSPAQPGLAQPGAFIPGQPAFAIPITVWNGQLTAAATAHASFGGTKTALGHFTAAATAHETAGGTRTTFGTLTTAVTAHMAATGTRTTFGSLTTAIAAHMTAAGTRTTFGSLTTTATAHMTAAGTKTGLGTLAAAATAHMTAAGTKTALGHLTSAATAAAAFTGTRAKFGTLTTAATAHAAFSGTRTTFGTLTTTATAHAVLAGTKTGLGHLTTTATAHAVLAGTRTQLGTLAAAATAHAVFAGTKTGLGNLVSSATAHMAAAGTKTALGHLTANATAGMAISSTGGKSGALTTAVTSHVTFAGTKTALGHLTTAATAHAAFTGTRTQFGHLTTTATAHVVLAGTKTGIGHLIANATASAGFHAVKATTGSLLASVTAHLTASAVHFLAHQPRNLGGTVLQEFLASGTDTLVPNPYGGTITQANLGGGNIVIMLGGAANTVANVLGGTISDPGLGGTLTSIPFGGGVTGWTMQNVNLNFAEFNDITLNVTITSNGSALNLTGYTVNMLLKPLAGVLDSDGRVLTLSSSGGSPAITITNAATGACTVAIPHTDLQDETHTFYRIDAVDGSGNINTAIYGNITYTSL